MGRSFDPVGQQRTVKALPTAGRYNRIFAMPIPADETERRLTKEFENCQQERGAAEYRILHPHTGGGFDDEKKLLAARDLARQKHDKTGRAPPAYRETPPAREKRSCPRFQNPRN